MEIYVMSRAQVEDGMIQKMDSSINKIVISILSPGAKSVDMKGENIKKVYSMRFHDIVSPVEPYTCFTKTDAVWLAYYVPKDMEKYNAVLVVHCEAGMSRSVAIAAAFAKYCNGNDDEYFNHLHPNRLVYKLMLGCLHELYDAKGD